MAGAEWFKAALLGAIMLAMYTSGYWAGRNAEAKRSLRRTIARHLGQKET